MQGFETWQDVLDHINARKPIYYHAPMDRNPVEVRAVVWRDSTLVRVIPPGSDASPFNADERHRDRFRFQ